MGVFKCKMCGGDIELSLDKTFGTCECCGSQMTFPKFEDEQKLSMFNRGNAFRIAGEFDKALALYENIVREDDTDAEAHWCCALCRFGIEYVEDPATFEYIPTCHRASFESFLEDIDYKAAVENADGITKKQYQKDAIKIADVQRGILATSQNEEPFDVFICYKENDDVTGQRTKDSVDAQEIYYQLTNEGYRVFFSRITLEGKAGTEYEPYIFAALNSAKVMVVVGSKPEYFNAVWVKNEWSRFLAIMRKDRSKLLLPCYRNMDPYDLPEQLSVLQSYDMTKIGFIQDLIRGIKKITAVDESKTVVKETVLVNNAVNSAAVAPLLKRAFLFLEDSKWSEADEYCEKVLDQDPECAEAYLGKLMAELHVKNKDNLKDVTLPFDDRDNCVKVSRFDSVLAEKLKSDNKFIRDRNETDRKQKIYDEAKSKMATSHTEEEFKSAASLFASIKGFKDTDEKAKECLEKAETARKNAIYDDAVHSMSVNTINGYISAIKKFEGVIDWKDSRSKINKCNIEITQLGIAAEKAAAERKRKAEEARIAAEKAKAKTKKILSVAIPAACVLIAFIIVLNTVILPASNYKKALAAVDAGKYEEAYLMFNSKPDYKDTKDQIKFAKTKQANELLKQKKYDEAYAILNEIGKTETINENMYARAIEYLEAKDYESAYALLEQLGDTDKINESIYDRAKEFVAKGDKISAYLLYVQIPDYKDSAGKIKEYKSVYYKDLFKKAKAGSIVYFGKYEQDNNTSNGEEDIEWRVLAKEDNRILVISEKTLDCKQYNTKDTSVTWETCSLRKWMNGTFYNAAFNKSEQEMIISSKVTADKNPKYSTDPGNDTTDKVFLLSIDEAKKYFSLNVDRKCVPTAYAINNGAYTSSFYEKDGKATCWWWLRSPSYGSHRAADVGNGGGVNYDGNYVNNDSGCVRPALWIEI